MKKVLYAIYPFLIASYPILALRNFNIAYVDLTSTFRTLLVVISLTAIIWIVLYFIDFRNWTQAGIVTSLAMIVILSYGHLHIQSAKLFGEPLRHSYLASILAILFLLLAWLTTRNPSAVENFRNYLATIAAILVLMSLGQSLYSDLGTQRAASAISAQEEPRAKVAASTPLPDIYLIVLDAHARQDVLKENYDYDNSSFIQGLQQLGFYTAQCSQSNYASTNLSLSSLFGMNYLPADLGGTSKLPPFKESVLLKTLTDRGYTIITFENRASGHVDLQEDIRLSKNQLLFGQLNLTGGINEFEEMMFQTSITKLFWDTSLIPGFSQEGLVQLENYEHYKQTKFILSELERIPARESPKFVFVHILVPHAPFIFTADGRFREVEDNSRNGYRDNAQFIDEAILPAIQTLLAESERPPVILLMGDHGPPPGKYAEREDRMRILNAYFVNEQATADLYDSITPVNSFRIILNHYLGESYPLLGDVSYFAYRLNQLGDAPTVTNNCAPIR